MSGSRACSLRAACGREDLAWLGDFRLPGGWPPWTESSLLLVLTLTWAGSSALLGANPEHKIRKAGMGGRDRLHPDYPAFPPHRLWNWMLLP